jgi:hypothetical protein
LDVVISQEGGGQAFGVVQIAGLQLIEIETMWPQFAFKPNPSSRGMGVVKVRRFAVKSLPAVLFFESAFGQADMGLIGGFAFFERIQAPSNSSIRPLNRSAGQQGTTCTWCFSERL